MVQADAEDELSSKVADWLSGEGYPLEYYVAHLCRQSGFRVQQGAYMKRADSNPREIDVLASMTKFEKGTRPLARMYTVAECKWTKKKPWVAFTANSGHMAPSAVIAQCLASELAESAVYLEAGDKNLQSLPLFRSPEKPSFGGRQALGSDSDVFYNALRSVVGAAHNLASRYNVYRGEEDVPDSAVLTFPLIVIDGDLFEASYDDNADKMNLDRVEQTRLHWKGSKDSPFLATVDVVTKTGLESFVRQRAEDTKVVLDQLFATANQLTDCFRNKSTAGLTVKVGPTGKSGMPPFLRALHERAAQAERATRDTALIEQHARKSPKVV